MGRPRQHGFEAREALLGAAIRVLGDEGPDALVIRRLADEVGLSTRAVYSVFGSKEGVLSALYVESFERIGARIEATPLTDDAAGDLVQVGLLAFREYALAHENLFRLVFERLVPALNPGAAELAVGHATFMLLSSRVARLEPLGALGGREVAQAAMQFHATCQGLASVELLGWLTPLGPERVWRDTLEALVHGFGRPAKRT